jgi:hypothetical protein
VRRGHGCWGVSKSSIAVKNLFTLAKGKMGDRSIERTGRLDSEACPDGSRDATRRPVPLL